MPQHCIPYPIHLMPLMVTAQLLHHTSKLYSTPHILPRIMHMCEPMQSSPRLQRITNKLLQYQYQQYNCVSPAFHRMTTNQERDISYFERTTSISNLPNIHNIIFHVQHFEVHIPYLLRYTQHFFSQQVLDTWFNQKQGK